MKVHIYLGESLWELKIICLYEHIEVSVQSCTCKCFIPPVFFFVFVYFEYPEKSPLPSPGNPVSSGNGSWFFVDPDWLNQRI